VPELPEVEITARRLDEALRGATIESTLAPGINALKTFDPPLQALDGRTIEGVRRIGKHLVVDVAGDLRVLAHLMSAGRLQLYDKRASLRDRTSRLLVRIDDGRELRLREFGTKQAAWVKVLTPEGLAADDAVATLGPEAWPDPPADLAALLEPHGARPLQAVLRDQRVITGIGRSWVDEILWSAQLSPFKRANELDADAAGALREAMIERLGGAIAHYEDVVHLPIPDKLPLPLEVHRHHGEPCPRCGTTIEAVHYEDRNDVPMIHEGEQAPDFELPDQDGHPVRLSDFRGRKVVVYFYPKASTPGCTTQACGVRDHEVDYESAGAVVLGISPDPVKAIRKFHDKQHLNFSLLADEDHRTAEDYGVWVEKSMYGKSYWGANRSTFLVDEDGVVRRVFKKVKPDTHDEEVLAALRELEAAA
jgi:formamidopyrimidine-DNA glycosylase